MRRSTLIIIIIFVLALAGGAVFFWLNQDQVTVLINKTPANKNTPLNANTNTAPIIGVAPELITGEQKLDATLTVNEITVTLTGVTRTGTFEGIAVDEGKVFVIVYFRPVSSADVLTVKRGLQNDSRLTSGTNSYALTGMKIASDLVINDSGYMKFVVPVAITKLQLEVGTGDSAQKVKLP